jgi:predicted RNase H-like HicB family nuclease
MLKSLLNLINDQIKMKTHKYEIIIYWSAEDESYLAEVPELTGCMADEHSYSEALSSAEEVISQWIETAHQINRAIPEPKGRLKYA